MMTKINNKILLKWVETILSQTYYYCKQVRHFEEFCLGSTTNGMVWLSK